MARLGDIIAVMRDYRNYPVFIRHKASADQILAATCVPQGCAII